MEPVSFARENLGQKVLESTRTTLNFTSNLLEFTSKDRQLESTSNRRDKLKVYWSNLNNCLIKDEYKIKNTRAEYMCTWIPYRHSSSFCSSISFFLEGGLEWCIHGCFTFSWWKGLCQKSTRAMLYYYIPSHTSQVSKQIHTILRNL